MSAPSSIPLGQAAHGVRFTDAHPGLEHAGGQGPYMPWQIGGSPGQPVFPQRPAWSPFPSQQNRYIGEPRRRSKSDDKVATATNVKYDPSAKFEWSKTIRNCLISKAFEMYHLLNWAENFIQTITSNDWLTMGSAWTATRCRCRPPLGIPQPQHGRSYR